MSKPVFITSDSTCDLTPELLERFNVKTAPLHVLLGEDTYLDGVNFTQEMIFERYAKDKTLPRTAAVSPQEFTDFFTPLVEAGYEVIFLSISSGLSGTYQNAVIAAQDLPGIYPIDTHKLTTGVGEMVLAACKMRDEGMDAASIAKAMEAMIPRVNVSFVIDTLEYMWKGGRCTGVAAFGANLLNLKPCIEMRMVSWRSAKSTGATSRRCTTSTSLSACRPSLWTPTTSSSRPRISHPRSWPSSSRIQSVLPCRM